MEARPPTSTDAAAKSRGAAPLGTSLTDAELVRRVQAGERELFGELHVRHHERVFHFVGQSIWQREAAQDVACEVWLRAYNAVDNFEIRVGASVLSWLLRIAANLVTDYRRRLGPEVESWEENEERLAPVLLTPATESQVINRERVRAVREAFQALSSGDQQIIYLAHQSGLTSTEIATALGKASVSAATSHLHRAMTHLRRRLQSEGWMEDGADLNQAKEK